MSRITFNDEEKLYSMEISNQEHNQLLDQKQNNELFYSVEFDGYFFLIYSPRFSINLQTGSRRIEFDNYYKSRVKIDPNFDYTSKMITLQFPKYVFGFRNFENFDITDKSRKFEFINNYPHFNNTFNIIITGDRNEIESTNLLSAVFHYFFFVGGWFVELDWELVFTDPQGGLIHQFIHPKYSDLKNRRYTNFSIPLTPQFIESSFISFIDVYSRNIFPLENFLYSQSNIPYTIQHRASLILNSLEGLIKRILEKKDWKIPLSQRDKKMILTSIKSNAENYMASEEFTTLLSDVSNHDDLDIMKRISNSLQRFDELTFKELLALSKEINESGMYFIEHIEPMPEGFWDRCIRHRNFHAHLTEDKHKGFNGSQSVYAIFILSNYFRLLVLELSKITNYDKRLLKTECTSINKWITNQNLTKIINQIK